MPHAAAPHPHTVNPHTVNPHTVIMAIHSRRRTQEKIAKYVSGPAADQENLSVY